ncbi:tripartite motif containing 13-like [Ruditapes philippinarum]|uniref:tripartite motif containing 13-like n=1 Tax=Ruditapes philippinarum TaxID=129788 RepID=UPI00295A9D3F|nr:tripartite motif containing 13-like [Ruditapes philippinarum]
MAVESTDSNWEPAEPHSLIHSLKCPVCWDYFVKPHTLLCGHTFCLRCLQNLARIVRAAKHRIPLDRLRFRCPSCRRLSLARPIIRRKAAINYAIREIMNEWFDSPYSSGSVNIIKLRSISCQTDQDQDSGEAGNDDAFHNIKVDLENLHLDDTSKESSEFHDDDSISKTEYRNVLFHKILSKSNLEKTPKLFEPIDPPTSSADENEGLTEDNTVTSSSEEDDSEQELAIAPLFGNLRIIDANDDVVNNRPRFTRFHATSVSGVLALLFAEINVIYHGIRSSRSRTVLTIFWFLYGGLIVYISRSFLPWMTFYTLIYFIIIYAEMSPAPLFR